MAYVELNDVAGVVPQQNLVNGLDDAGAAASYPELWADALEAAGSGQTPADKTKAARLAVFLATWAAVQRAAINRVHAPLEGRFPLPFAAPAPAVIQRAALLFACELVYARRGVKGKDNLHEAAANEIENVLRDIGEGKRPISARVSAVPGAGGVIAEAPSLTTPREGTALMV